jgi:hypothetical protein
MLFEIFRKSRLKPVLPSFQTAYNNLATELKVSYLLEAIQNAQVPEDGRVMAAVLLRRLFSSDFHAFYTGVSLIP